MIYNKIKCKSHNVLSDMLVIQVRLSNNKYTEVRFNRWFQTSTKAMLENKEKFVKYYLMPYMKLNLHTLKKITIQLILTFANVSINNKQDHNYKCQMKHKHLLLMQTLHPLSTILSSK